MLLEEGCVRLKSDPSLSLAKEREELFGAIAERVENAVQLARSEILGPRNSGNVANQFLELVAADSHAEVPPGNILDLVRFVKNDSGILRNDSAELLVLDREIGEEQMMIYDDDVAFVRPLVHLGYETALELLAFLSGAKVAPGIDLLPG